MSQTIIKGIKELNAEALSTIEEMSIAEAKTLYQDENYIFVDVREAAEREEHGIIPGA